MKKATVLLDSSSMYDGKSEKNIFMIPLKIILNENGIKEYKEIIEINNRKIYGFVEEGKKLSTSQPSIGEGLLMIENLLKEYETIYVLPISKDISGTYDMFKSISRELDKKRVIVLNCGFVGDALLNILAKNILEMVENGEGQESIIKYVEETWRSKFLSALIVNDIGHLKRGGRIGTIASFFAELLKFKIILKMDGKLDLVDKKTSLKDAVDVSLRMINDKIDFLKNGIAKIEILSNNRDDPKIADKVKKYITDWLVKENVDFNKSSLDNSIDFPGVVTIHTGTDTIGIFVLAK